MTSILGAQVVIELLVVPAVVGSVCVLARFAWVMHREWSDKNWGRVGGWGDAARLSCGPETAGKQTGSFVGRPAPQLLWEEIMQTELKLEDRPTSALVGLQRIMAEYQGHEGGWWTLWGLQEELYRRFGLQSSEAAISARIRDLRKAGWKVDRRLWQRGRKPYTYRLRTGGTA